jgi:hypothetical protein
MQGSELDLPFSMSFSKFNFSIASGGSFSFNLESGIQKGPRHRVRTEDSHLLKMLGEGSCSQGSLL